jgi:hypothetical protein
MSTFFSFESTRDAMLSYEIKTILLHTPALKEKLQRVVKEVSLCDKATSAQLVAFHSSMSRENGGGGSQDFSQEFIDFGLF